ncbi:hypothetical protein JR316_0003928 [Psilocybe cubensis]|uniref:Uncharacterized protein n=2 Tax=Psilocybe cubensis TaxID=181762 RepID=A0A8H8CNJ4_PSICU|nr:hypothetical protein JR316_0003928 [Psilocybe cubensis]KAH9484446.1 hypothetical protein JR316_0003928 [Psilocybe cubensis]
MTEYTTSSQAYRDYMSARERTAHWVQACSPTGYEGGLYSPSVPPSVLDGLVPSSPPSEADSSHSTPPKMVLRYNDGRPDVPIPHPNGVHGSMSGSKRHQEPNLTRSHSHPYNHPSNHSRSGSSADSPSHQSRHRRPDPNVPEEIKILPTYGDAPASSTSSRPGHSRSRSVPRPSERHEEPVPDVPFIPSHLQSQSPYYASHAANQQGVSPTSQQVSFAQTPHAWPRHGHAKHPPAIIYAPSHHTQRPHYAPPAMFHHPPQMGANGMMYSHSAPVPGQYPPAYPTPYPSVGSHRHTASAHDVSVNRNYRSLGRSSRRDPSASVESLGSEKSGSTYYVLPNHGQKVHVIDPSPEPSIVTATSTTKSPTSPYFGEKKPFFHRLFGNMFSSSGSSRGSSTSSGRKLHRRHSIGAQHRAE